MDNVTRSRLSINSLLLVLLALTVHVLAQKVPPQECATGVHAIFAQGKGDGDDYTDAVTIADLVLQQIPGSTTVGLPYDHGDANVYEAVASGSQLYQQYIADYADSCPQTKIMALGYSMGAISLMNALCGTSSKMLPPINPIDPKYVKHVPIAVGYGDWTYNSHQPWDRGNCTEGVGIFARENPMACEIWAPNLQNYCDADDKQCCTPVPFPDSPGHHEYYERHNNEVMEFVKSKVGPINNGGSKTTVNGGGNGNGNSADTGEPSPVRTDYVGILLDSLRETLELYVKVLQSRLQNLGLA